MELNDPYWQQQLSIHAKLFNRKSDIHIKDDSQLIQAVKRKYFTGMLPYEIVNLITSNTTSDNKEDNEMIIAFIKGDDKIIWKLYEKYKDAYRINLENFYSTIGIHVEQDVAVSDFCMDGFMSIMKQIKFGRYKGINFPAWSIYKIKYLAMDLYYAKNNIKRSHKKNK